MLALEVAALAPLPEVRRVAVRLVLVAVVDVDAVGGVERATAARAAPAAAFLVDAFAMAVSRIG